MYLGPLPEHPFGVSLAWWSYTNNRGACRNQGLLAVVAALLFIFIILLGFKSDLKYLLSVVNQSFLNPALVKKSMKLRCIH